MADDAAVLELQLEIRRAMERLGEFDKRWAQTTQSAARESRAAGEDVGGLTSRFDALHGAITAIAGSLVALKIGQFIRESIGAAAEAEDAMARVQASIEATGGAAKRSADDIGKIADRIRDTTTFTDEEVLGLSNTLLGFTHIIGSTFDRAVADIVDLSAKTRRGVEEVALAVGKALDAPKEGLAGLARIGVRFSDQQQAVIERLVETGRVADAQGIILAELEKRARGAAVALNDTLGGALKNLKDDWGEVQEAFGQGLGESLKSGLKDIEAGLSGADDAARGLGQAVGGVLVAAKPLIPVVSALVGGFLQFEAVVARWAANAVSNVTTVTKTLADLAAKALQLGAGLPVVGDGFAMAAAAAGRLRKEIEETGGSAAKGLDAAAAGFGKSADSILSSVLGINDGLQQAGKAADEQTTPALDRLGQKAASTGAALREHVAASANEARKSLEEMAAAARAVEAQGAGLSGSRPSDVASLGDQQKALQDTIAALKAKQEQGSLTAEELASLFESEDKLRVVQRDLQVATLDVNAALAAQAAAAQETVDPMEAGADAARRYAEAGLEIPGMADAAGQSLGEFAAETRAAREEMDAARFTVENTGDAADMLAEQWLAAGKAGSGLAEQSDKTKAAIAGLVDHQRDGIDASEKLATAVGKTTDAVRDFKDAGPAEAAGEMASQFARTAKLIETINDADHLGKTKVLLQDIVDLLHDAQAGSQAA